MCVLQCSVCSVGLLLLLLSVCVAHLHLSSPLHPLSRYPDGGSVWGVFEVSVCCGYSFNASVARQVCLQMGVAMATKAQVEQARQHGLQTCRFGWVDEQVAVVPRLRASGVCGRNGTGLVLWRAPLSRLFDTFCFNHTDRELQLNATMTTVQPIRTQTTALSSSPLPLLLHLTGSPVEQTLTSTAAPTAGVATMLLITAVCLMLLLGVTSLWCIRRKAVCCPLLSVKGHCSTELKDVCVLPSSSNQKQPTPASIQSEPTPPASTQSEPTPASTQSQPTPASTQSQPTPASTQSEPTPAASTQSQPTPAASNQSEPTLAASTQSEPMPPASTQSEPTPPTSNQSQHT